MMETPFPMPKRPVTLDGLDTWVCAHNPAPSLSYGKLLDRLHRMETIAAIREGTASAERGELKPAEQVFAEMQARQGPQG